MRPRPSHTLSSTTPIRALPFFLILVVTACSTAPPQQTGLQRSLGATVSSQEIRLRATEYAAVFAQVVELSADSILALADSRPVARAALVWKTYAVPAIYRSSTLPDPLAAWLDSRVLTLQMLEYFETGAGRDLFGDLQPIAVNASRLLVDEFPRVARLAGQEADPERDRRIIEYARERPIQNPYFFRRTAVDDLAGMMSQDRLSGLQAVGSLTEQMNDLSQRLNVYMELLPRNARWQAELMIAELSDPERSAVYLDALNQMETMVTLRQFLQYVPNLANEQRDYLLEAVDVQRLAFEATLRDYIRTATDTVFARVGPERELVMRDAERLIGGQIESAVAGIDATISTAVADIDVALRDAVDRLFVRLLQLVAIVCAFLLLLGFLLRSRLVPSRAE